jgi:hypothetical protein
MKEENKVIITENRKPRRKLSDLREIKLEVRAIVKLPS